MLSAEKIESNFNLHLKIINTYIKERKDRVEAMIEALGETYVMAPASGKAWYHNAFPGGYIDHVNNVVRFSLKEKALYKEMGGTIDFSEEELVFSALFHDLGKIGNGEKPNHIYQTDKWRQEKLDEIYTFNPEIDFMLVPDRSLFLLQKFGIEVSMKEYLGIKLHDGMFEEANSPYLRSNSPNSRLKTNLPYILHAADYLASKVEYDLWKNSQTK